MLLRGTFAVRRGKRSLVRSVMRVLISGSMLAAMNGNDIERIRYAFRRVLTRTPSADETKLAVSFLAVQRNRLRTGQLNAQRIAGVKANAIDVAAWTTLARVFFGLDETVIRN